MTFDSSSLKNLKEMNSKIAWMNAMMDRNFGFVIWTDRIDWFLHGLSIFRMKIIFSSTTKIKKRHQIRACPLISRDILLRRLYYYTFHWISIVLTLINIIWYPTPGTWEYPWFQKKVWLVYEIWPNDLIMPNYICLNAEYTAWWRQRQQFSPF